ncbi:hypothetical protein DAPPUDRAFT_316297 [Daphnia pulex]|uniref:BTB domain-containing protein n=1 Tax=Daphnia pulex TaxID=6669 RepID=E9GCG4_DAPPU|nr:hypothetical protein DAPPUDRAFT_316297 [Daphnia pulex]|eukprot:EFX82554.1 hypothetical protein DAPPUDRAFT_316297 [Daphnia pulex]
MTSEAMMIVPYEWILENVEKQTTTIASKIISFRGEKVFRVGLKNHAKRPILFLMAIDLRKMGMKVKDVKYGMHGSGIGPATMEQMFREDMDDEGSLQLFIIKLYEKFVGNCTFSFRICIEGTDPGYSYRLSDRLAKDQLWAALKNQKHLVDVELIVKDKIFPAHKSILAARSPVFADKFEKKKLVKDGPHQIRIDGVEPSTVENFLHFIYTGEPKGTLANEELLKLAHYYQLSTLENLCQDAVRKIDLALQIASIMKCLNSNADEEMSSSKIT